MGLFGKKKYNTDKMLAVDMMLRALKQLKKGDYETVFELAEAAYSKSDNSRDKLEKELHYEICSLLGMLYSTGNHGARPDLIDREKAEHYLLIAARKGDNLSAFLLGKMYFESKRITPKFADAAYWLHQSEREVPEAKTLLSEMYDLIKLDSDEETVETLLSSTDFTDIDDPDAQYYLALAYTHGTDDVEPNGFYASIWAGVAADQEHEDAIRLIGDLEERGLLQRYSRYSDEYMKQITVGSENKNLPEIYSKIPCAGKTGKQTVLEMFNIGGYVYCITNYEEGDDETVVRLVFNAAGDYNAVDLYTMYTHCISEINAVSSIHRSLLQADEVAIRSSEGIDGDFLRVLGVNPNYYVNPFWDKILNLPEIAESFNNLEAGPDYFPYYLLMTGLYKCLKTNRDAFTEEIERLEELVEELSQSGSEQELRENMFALKWLNGILRIRGSFIS